MSPRQHVRFQLLGHWGPTRKKVMGGSTYKERGEGEERLGGPGKGGRLRSTGEVYIHLYHRFQGATTGSRSSDKRKEKKDTKKGDKDERNQ